MTATGSEGLTALFLEPPSRHTRGRRVPAPGCTSKRWDYKSQAAWGHRNLNTLPPPSHPPSACRLCQGALTMLFVSTLSNYQPPRMPLQPACQIISRWGALRPRYTGCGLFNSPTHHLRTLRRKKNSANVCKHNRFIQVECRPPPSTRLGCCRQCLRD